MTSSQEYAGMPAKKLSTQEVEERLKTEELFILDVRPVSFSHCKMSLKNTFHLPLLVLADNLENIPRDKKILITDSAAKQAQLAYKFLVKNDFQVIGVLLGGLEVWYSEGRASEERVRIFQLFQNLLSNSIKFMDKKAGLIHITCQNLGGFYHFSVADNGPGMKEEYFDKVFEIFQCLAPRDEHESTGIGLSLVKKNVRLYNGEIWIESTVGQGTVFHFTLDKSVVGKEPEASVEKGLS